MRSVYPNIRPAKGKFLAFGVSPHFDQLAWLWEGGLLTLHVRDGYAQAHIVELSTPLPMEGLCDAQVLPYLLSPGDRFPELESLALIRWMGGKSLLCSGNLLRVDYCHTDTRSPLLAALSTRTCAISVRKDNVYISWDTGQNLGLPGSHSILQEFLEGRDLCRVSYLRHDGTVVIAATKNRTVDVLVWNVHRQSVDYRSREVLGEPPTDLVLHPQGTSALAADSEILWVWRNRNSTGMDYFTRARAGKFFHLQRFGYFLQGDHPGGYDLFENHWEVQSDGSLWTTFSGRLDVV